MQTATTQRTVKARTKAPVYPDLPQTSHKGFWLAALLRDQAEMHELEQLITKAYAKFNGNKPRNMALMGAHGHQQRELNESARNAQEFGLLPFAHAHTTYFDQQLAA
jgi:hypothetical protein